MDNGTILARQTALLYRNIVTGQIVSILVAVCFAWLWRNSTGSAAYLWCTMAVLVAIGRCLLYFAYRRSIPATAQAPSWLRRARVGAAAGGFIWSIGVLLFILTGDSIQQVFTGLVAAGMIGGAIPVLAPDKHSFRLYAWPINLAVAAAAFHLDELHIALAVMSLVFMAGVTRSAMEFHKTLMETLRLGYEKEQLAEHLEQARSDAEASNRVKLQFLASISHELRTPMNGIVGMADLLAMEELPTDQRTLLDTLQRSSGELLKLINDLILVARLEAGQVETTPSLFAPEDFLAGLSKSYRDRAAAKGLQFELKMEALPAALIGDVAHLRQILHHLLDNALKFTREGGVGLEVRVASSVGKTWHLEFVVRDTGPGIEPEQQQEIFELFTQGDASVTRHFGGTGLGLALCRRLVALLDGALTLDSTAGQGSAFHLQLQFVDAEGGYSTHLMH